MINAESLAKCKDGVRLLNFARNELVNVADVKTALESGKVSCYICDFPNEETVGVDGIITLPHLGASTPEAEDNCATMAAKEIMAYLEDGNIVNSVNYLTVQLLELLVRQEFVFFIRILLICLLRLLLSLAKRVSILNI